jgi:hypothetical protein
MRKVDNNKRKRNKKAEKQFGRGVRGETTYDVASFSSCGLERWILSNCNPSRPLTSALRY